MSDVTTSLVSAAKTAWWLFLLRGIFAIIFGIIAIFQPFATAYALAVLAGVYLLIDGIISIVNALVTRTPGSAWGWNIVWGIISILAGIVIFSWPGQAILYTILLLAFWALVLGITQVIGAFAWRKASQNQSLWLIISGILTVILGIVLLSVSPIVSIAVLQIVTGIFVLAFGISLVILAIQVRSEAKSVIESAEAREETA